MITVTGVAVTLTWSPPPETPGLLSYTLSCSVDGAEALTVVLKSSLQEFTLEELLPATSYVCSFFASTSGGDGPTALHTFDTEGLKLQAAFHYCRARALFSISK